MIFHCTDLRKAVSAAKFDAESDFEVRLAVAPPKSIKIHEKLIYGTEKTYEKCFLASTKRKLQIVRNACCRTFAPIGAKFEQTDVRSSKYRTHNQWLSEYGYGVRSRLLVTFEKSVACDTSYGSGCRHFRVVFRTCWRSVFRTDGLSFVISLRF